MAAATVLRTAVLEYMACNQLCRSDREALQHPLIPAIHLRRPGPDSVEPTEVDRRCIPTKHSVAALVCEQEISPCPALRRKDIELLTREPGNRKPPLELRLRLRIRVMRCDFCGQRVDG